MKKSGVREHFFNLHPSNTVLAYVLSSRVRVARNLSHYRFPTMASCQERAVVSDVIRTAAAALPWFARTVCLDIDALTALERRVLEEKRLISPLLATQGTHRLAMIHDAGHFSILVNEEDHLRIQAIQPGFHLQRAWRRANMLERSLTEKLAFAYSDHEGYLTSCGSNRGAGIRASVMVFLPGLRRSQRLIPVLRRMSEAGCTIRGVYGEGSGSQGDVLQISTQITRGHDEAASLNQFESLCRDLITEERRARRRLLMRSPVEVFSALRTVYTTGRNATRLEFRPALRIWAALRFETVLRLERDRLARRPRHYRWYFRRLGALDELGMRMQPAHLLQALDAWSSTQDEQQFRAHLIQSELRMTPLLRK